jgi:spermidine/putrescine transport system substrate-binding protein
MITKLKLNPKAAYDMINGTGPESFIRLKKLGLLQRINHDWIPNVNAYLMDKIKNLPFDPGYQYSVSDSIYFTNYVFNKKYVDPNDPNIDSWKILFEGEKYAGKMTMINDAMHPTGAALKYLGYSYNSDNEEELMKAKEVLLRQKPRVLAYDSWPRRLILEEEVWISHLSSDGWPLHQADKNIMSALPREGAYMGTDLSVIPIGSTHPATAHLWLNYLFRTEVYALLINTIAYSSIHKAALPLLDKEMLKWPGAQVSEEYMEKCEFIDPKALSGKGFELRLKIWEELKQ